MIKARLEKTYGRFQPRQASACAPLNPGGYLLSTAWFPGINFIFSYFLTLLPYYASAAASYMASWGEILIPRLKVVEEWQCLRI